MLRSVFSNWFGLLLAGVISVILTPILIHGLGNYYYGLWIMVASTLDYCGLLEMGMRWTLFRFVARFKGAKDREGLNQTLVTALAMTGAIAIALIGLTFILWVFLPGFFGLSGPSRTVFRWLLGLLGVSVALAFPQQFLAAYIRGLQRFDLYNLGLVVSSTIRAILLIAVLRLGFGVIAVACVTLGVTAFSLLLHWWLTHWADPELEISRSHINRARVRELLSYSFYSFVSNIGEYIRFYSDPLVIGRVLGVALITTFSVATRLMEYFKSLMGAVNGPLMVELSELDGQSREGDLVHSFLRATRLTALLSFLVAAFLMLNGRMLIRLWVGENFLASYPLLFTLAIGYAVAFALHPCYLLIFAQARNHRNLAWWTMAEGITNVALSIYLAKRYGLIGNALGTTIPLLFVRTFVLPYYALRDLRLPVFDFLMKGLLRPLAACGLFVAACWLLARPQMDLGFLRSVWVVACHMVFFGILSYSVGLLSYERQSILLRGRRLVTSLGLMRA